MRLALACVLPLAFIATLPARVLLHEPTPGVVLAAIGAGITAALLATGAWRLSLRRYTGATS